jgi:glucose/mannose transport system substrate-binding protein
LAVGDVTTQLQLFECVLIADLGVDAYRSLWSDADAWRTLALDAAIGHFGRLLEFTQPGTSSEPAASVVAQVITGDAAYAVLADTTLATFQEAGFEDGTYAAAPAPGTRGVFDLRADAFALPSGASHPDAASQWLRTVASKEGQEVFAAAKGALPGRVGTRNTFDSEYQVAAGWSLSQDEVVPSLAAGVAASPTLTDEIAGAVERFSDDRKPAVLKNALLAAAADL